MPGFQPQTIGGPYQIPVPLPGQPQGPQMPPSLGQLMMPQLPPTQMPSIQGIPNLMPQIPNNLPADLMAAMGQGNKEIARMAQLAAAMPNVQPPPRSGGTEPTKPRGSSTISNGFTRPLNTGHESQF